MWDSEETLQKKEKPREEDRSDSELFTEASMGKRIYSVNSDRNLQNSSVQHIGSGRDNKGKRSTSTKKKKHLTKFSKNRGKTPVGVRRSR